MKPSKQPKIGSSIKKTILYDCNSGDDSDLEIPDEAETFVKGNLLKFDKESSESEKLSIVNINVSLLYSDKSPVSEKSSTSNKSKLSIPAFKREEEIPEALKKINRNVNSLYEITKKVLNNKSNCGSTDFFESKRTNFVSFSKDGETMAHEKGKYSHNFTLGTRMFKSGNKDYKEQIVNIVNINNQIDLGEVSNRELLNTVKTIKTNKKWMNEFFKGGNSSVLLLFWFELFFDITK